MFYLAIKHWNYPDDPFVAGEGYVRITISM